MTVAVLAQPPGVAHHPSLGLILAAGLLALALSVVLWPVIGIAITIAHEGGHAVTASLAGGSVQSIRVGHNRSGLTTFTGAGPMATFAAALAGYLGPSLFGLLGAWLLTGGYVTAVLWLSLLLLALALVQAADFLSGVLVVLTGALLVVVVRFGSPGSQIFFAYVWVWLLLLGGFGHVLVLQNLRRSDEKDEQSDVYRLRQLTFLPASLWSGLFWLLTLAGLLYGAGLLLGLT